MSRWNQVPAGRLMTALQKLLLNLGDSAENVVDRLCDDPLYVRAVAPMLLNETQTVPIDRSYGNIPVLKDLNFKVEAFDSGDMDQDSIRIPDIMIKRAADWLYFNNRKSRKDFALYHTAGSRLLGINELNSILAYPKMIPNSWFDTLGDNRDGDLRDTEIVFGGTQIKVDHGLYAGTCFLSLRRDRSVRLVSVEGIVLDTHCIAALPR